MHVRSSFFGLYAKNGMFLYTLMKTLWKMTFLRQAKIIKRYMCHDFLYMLDNAIMLFVDDKGGETYELINTMS